MAQDVIITEDDCGTKLSKRVTKEVISGLEIPLAKTIRGRILAKDIALADGSTLFKKGHLISKDDATLVEQKGVRSIRSNTNDL